jgi:4-amino-4-deoxy-L-arabinose transferase-like glycosyltransferase
VFPLSLILIYLCGIEIQGRLTGILSIILLSSNALMLLHSRRAMAESALVFLLILSLWVLLKFKSHIWFAAVPIAFAINTKQNLFFLVIVGLIALIYHLISQHRKALFYVKTFFLYFFIIGFISFILNPFIWKDPIHSIKFALTSRVEQTKSQVAAINSVSPEAILNQPGERISGLLGNLFFLKPAIADVGNYLHEQQQAKDQYFSNPLNVLFRNLIGGSVMFFLAFLGFIILFIDFIKTRSIKLLILILSILLSTLQHLLSISLPWQRYVMIFIPGTCLLIGYVISRIFLTIIIKIPSKNPHSMESTK